LPFDGIALLISLNDYSSHNAFQKAIKNKRQRLLALPCSLQKFV